MLMAVVDLEERRLAPALAPITTLSVVTSVSQPRRVLIALLSGDAEHHIVGDERVKNGIRNLVGHLVRVTFGYGFAREKVALADTFFPLMLKLVGNLDDRGPSCSLSGRGQGGSRGGVRVLPRPR